MSGDIIHTEPCGCRYRQIDVPDDVAIGQGWALTASCAEHRGDATDRAIIATCEAHGVDADRLERCLRGRDNWGRMINAFEYLTVCEAVLVAMKASRSAAVQVERAVR